MTNQTNKLRTVIAIAICLAVTFNANAQLGNLNNLKDKTKDAAKDKTTSTTSTSASDAVQEKAETAAAQAKLSPQMQAAINKLNDESKRTAPKVKEICDYQSDFHLIKEWFGVNKGGIIATQTEESVKKFKAAIEARTAENREIICALFELPENYDCYNLTMDYNFGKSNYPEMKEGVMNHLKNYPFEIMTELAFYQAIMSMAEQELPTGEVTHSGSDDISIKVELRVGMFGAAKKDGDWVFFGPGDLITPADQNDVDNLLSKCTMVMDILRRTPPAAQYDGYWIASEVSSRASKAQKNSIKMQQKLPVPAAKMNDAALTAKMLKLAQEKYPQWGIVKLIIVESDWKPEYNALGQIVRRRINTKIIHQGGGNGYVMETLNFAQPYVGGSYGETQLYALGTDRIAVDYK